MPWRVPTPMYPEMKRLFDILVSAAGLIALFPVFVILIPWIRMTSPGDAFYRQERIGKDAKPFYILKFRTMKMGADKGPAITIGEMDSRITGVGAFLRKYKLDELPQLINVLRGDMSLVGPRPEVRKFTDLYTPEQRNVFSIRPGITDLASITFRNENKLLEGKPDPIRYYIDVIMPEKLEMNLYYVKERSFWLDIKIIVRTVWSIVKP